VWMVLSSSLPSPNPHRSLVSLPPPGWQHDTLASPSSVGKKWGAPRAHPLVALRDTLERARPHTGPVLAPRSARPSPHDLYLVTFGSLMSLAPSAAINFWRSFKIT
jgi:hypothetical protein